MTAILLVILSLALGFVAGVAFMGVAYLAQMKKDGYDIIDGHLVQVKSEAQHENT